ncbi:hypothetical protein Tco_1546507 [Tanacetum coccineum]
MMLLTFIDPQGYLMIWFYINGEDYELEDHGEPANFKRIALFKISIELLAALYNISAVKHNLVPLQEEYADKDECKGLIYGEQNTYEDQLCSLGSNSKWRLTSVDGVEQTYPPTTAEEKLARKDTPDVSQRENDGGNMESKKTPEYTSKATVMRISMDQAQKDLIKPMIGFKRLSVS